MSIPPEPRDVPTCATDTIGELPPAAMDGTNYQSDVAILRAQLAEQQAQHQAELSRVAMASADLELAHESDVRELERRLAEAQRESDYWKERYERAIREAREAHLAELSRYAKTAAYTDLAHESDLRSLTARLERAEGAHAAEKQMMLDAARTVAQEIMEITLQVAGAHAAEFKGKLRVALEAALAGQAVKDGRE